MDISPRVARWVDREFSPGVATRVHALLGDLTVPAIGRQDPERIQAALVIRSDGDWSKVEGMHRLANQDWRDLLMAAGLGGPDWPSVLDDVLGRESNPRTGGRMHG